MKITILTYGSRGDVQPFIHLSLGLMARGHFVKLVAPARFQNLVEEYSIPFVPIAGDPAELSRHLNDSGANILKMIRGLLGHAVEIGADVLRQAEAACEDADLIVHTFMHAVGAHTLAREKNIPDVHVQLFPMFTPTGDYPNISLPHSKLKSWNLWTHKLAHRIAFWTSKFGYEQVRRQAGLPKRKLYSPFDDHTLRPRTLVLCAWSPIVVPPCSDWTPNIHVTGYFFSNFDDAYQPSDVLNSFLAAGEPPVCISFGSMLNRDAEKIDRIVREALTKTNHRAIILSGWSTLNNMSSGKIIYFDSVPHQWLFPRCKAVIHHGGAGTTSAGLRAGIPNIVIPFAADQPFWANRVHAIGTGPKPIMVKELSVENLTQAIIESEHQAVCKQSRFIAQNLRRENGVAASVALIEKYYDEFHSQK